MSRGVIIIPDVIRYVESRRGQMITLEDLERALPESNGASIQRVMLDLSRRDLGLEVLSAGKAWRLSNPNGTARVIGEDDMRDVVRELKQPRPTRPTSVSSQAVQTAFPSQSPLPVYTAGDMFEYVGSTSEGVVLRDEHGNLWSAKRM